MLASVIFTLFCPLVSSLAAPFLSTTKAPLHTVVLFPHALLCSRPSLYSSPERYRCCCLVRHLLMHPILTSPVCRKKAPSFASLPAALLLANDAHRNIV